jgi:uncharacterized phage protein gp47/JayE
MAFTPQRKNAAAIAREMRNRFKQRTSLTSFSEDSKSRVLLDIVSDQIVSEREQMIEVIQSRELATAFGESLDRLGARQGLTRLTEAFSGVNASERVFAFYVASGTFGDLNGGNPFSIPRGTVVRSEVNQNALNTAVEFTVTEEIVCEAAAAVVYAPIRAKIVGTGSNLAAGVLVYHSYSGVGSGDIQCTNFAPILSGRDRESDNSFRFRIANQYQSLLSVNDVRTKLAALEVPGVVDVRVVPGYFGIGTVGVAVLGTDYASNPGLVASVQRRLDAIKGHGGRVVAMSAVTVYFDLEIEVVPTQVLTTGQRNQAKAAMRRAAVQYLRTIPIGGNVSLAALASAMKSAAGLGTQLRNKSVFKNVYVRKAAGVGDVSERDKLLVSTLGLDRVEYADLGTLDISFVSN